MAISPSRSDGRQHWTNELSAGGVVFKKEGADIYILLIVTLGNRGKNARERYGFPKGWTGDHGKESLEETALREVREEGGVDANILEDLGSIHYFFSWEGRHISKTVHYYLMEYVSGSIEDHDDEVVRVEWVLREDVPSKLVHKTEREVFARANKFINDL